MAKGLGRGLDAFFGEDTEQLEKITKPKSNKEIGVVVELKISDVEPMSNQPRKIFDSEKLQELADSIKENGVLQPILVVTNTHGYSIVAGERRWRAAKIAGLKTIPAIVKEYTDIKKKQVALIENIQREDLNVVEIARAIKELMEMDGYSHSDIAKITGKNISTVSNIMRLLKLQDTILQALMEGKIVEGHARALLAIDNKKRQLDILEKIIEKKLSVRDAEKLVYGSEEYVRKDKKPQPKNIYYDQIQNQLKDYFGYKVRIDHNTTNQRIVIEYKDVDGLESILNKLKIKL